MKSSWSEALDTLARQPATTALFIDFDGTITAIVDDPANAKLRPTDIDLLKRLASKLHTVAIVSARPGPFLADRLALTSTGGSKLCAYGRGGLDVVDGRGSVTSDTSFDSWLPIMIQLAQEARSVTPEATVEEKGIVVALHWRRAPHTEDRLRAFATAVAIERGLVTRDGKMSIECLPPGTPNKGTVVATLSQGCEAVAYFGDDVGDLDGFSALDGCAATTTTVRIAVEGDDMPPELAHRANLLLDGPNATLSFLTDLAAATGV